MGKVIYFNGITTHDLPADRILEEAMGKLEGVVLAGVDKEGSYYFGSSYANGGTVLWLLKQCERKLLSFEDEEEMI